MTDVRYTLRSLVRAPGFTAVVVLTLAVGIGANAAIFSVVRGVLLRSLPYRAPEELVRLFSHWKMLEQGSVSPAEYVDYRAMAHSLADEAAFAEGSANLSGDGEPERLSLGYGTASLLPVLGAAPARGRWFAAGAEEQPGQDQVIVLGDALWRRHFNADPGAIGRTIRLDGLPYVVVGVLPPGFDFFGTPDAWVPIAFRPEQLGEDQRGNHFLRVVARLRPGVNLASARAELDVIGARFRAEHPIKYPADSGFNPELVPLLDQVVGTVRPALWLLAAAAGLVLLIACANVANLLLARGAGREREMSLRAALGAGRARLVRQLLTESLILALAGGGLGLLVAMWGVDLLLGLAPDALPRPGAVHVDGLVLGFSVALSALTGVVFGLVPALAGSRVDLHDALRSGGRTSAGRRPRRLRQTLVVAEVALALILVTGAGLVTRSFANVIGVDPGFPTDHLLTLRVDLPTPNGPPTPADEARYLRFFTDAIARLRRLPGVAAAGAIDALPFAPWGTDNTVAIEDFPTPPGAQLPDHEIRVVMPGFFEALGAPLLRGRTFTAADRADSEPVVVINDAFARRYWHGADPTGRRLLLDRKGMPWSRIVGVVDDVREFGLDADVRPEMYFPLAQLPGRSALILLVRASVPEAEIARPARAALAALDPAQPVYDVRPVRELLAQSLERRRFALVLFELFGALALVLAAVGIYGVMAHGVAQRTHEIGVRMALGARRGNVVALVAREGALLVGLGVALGVAGALAATRALGAVLFGVSPHDPTTLAGAALLLGAAAALATWLPARRATQVDPMQALRDE
jgi:predicted permease